MADKPTGQKLIAENRRARFDYFLEENLEAGLSLTGSEVKSLRLGRANIAESYASAEGREIVLINAYIPEYGPANRFNHEPRRPRKLLLHRRQIDTLVGKIRDGNLTLVPLSMYFSDGRVKVELALARGKQAHDKRQDLARRDAEREVTRELGRRVKGMTS